MPEPKLDEVVSNLKAGDPKPFDEAESLLKIIRDAARQAGKHILAKSVQQGISAVQRSSKILTNEAAEREEAEKNKETIAQTAAIINGKDNNTNKQSSNITANMSQADRPMRP